MESPLHQFVIKTLIPIQVGDFDLSFTNAALFMLLSVITIFFIFAVSLRKQASVPGKMQSLAELTLKFIQDMVHENVGEEGKRFMPFVLSLFLFILLGNLFGMIPYSYTFTSQIILTFGLAMLVFLMVTVVGFARHGMKFFSYFLPAGTPIILAPLLIVIELISYLSRPVSLSIRLFANMMAGHTMLKVFALFTISLGVYGFSTILANILLIGFEFLVAFLQAYVFSVLTCLYLKDAVHLH
jgi:F-type H+-transporting ATPase subunit a